MTSETGGEYGVKEKEKEMRRRAEEDSYLYLYYYRGDGKIMFVVNSVFVYD